MLIGCLWVWVFWGRINWINTFGSFGCPSLQTRASWGIFGNDLFGSYLPSLHLFLFWNLCVVMANSCPVWVGPLSYAPFLQFQFLFLPLAILETFFCGWKQLSVTVLPQDKDWSLAIMQQSFLWVALSKIRLKTQDRRLQIRQNGLAIKNSTLSKYWWKIV